MGRYPARILFRARRRTDIENLVALSGMEVQVIKTPTGDYAWRIVTGKAEVAMALDAMVKAIDYFNFKDRIHNLPDQCEKIPIYSRLWSQLFTFQSRQKIS